MSSRTQQDAKHDPSRAKPVFFISHVKPLTEKHCRSHETDGKTEKGLHFCYLLPHFLSRQSLMSELMVRLTLLRVVGELRSFSDGARTFSTMAGAQKGNVVYAQHMHPARQLIFTFRQILLKLSICTQPDK